MVDCTCATRLKHKDHNIHVLNVLKLVLEAHGAWLKKTAQSYRAKASIKFGDSFLETKLSEIRCHQREPVMPWK